MLLLLLLRCAPHSDGHLVVRIVSCKRVYNVHVPDVVVVRARGGGAVTSGSPRYFLGTDSAPHTAASKECACGAAGMFTAHAALELYAAVFEEAGCLQHLQAFACENGPRFYGLPANAQRLPGSAVEIREEAWQVPESYEFGGATVVPVLAGQTLRLKAYVV